MVKKRRQLPDRHKQSLGDQLEDPETYGVRVSWAAVPPLSGGEQPRTDLGAGVYFQGV